MPDLTYRRVGPHAYRVSFDGVEVGSISERHQHVQQQKHWHWGVDTMPLMDHGGHPPSGDVWSFEAALAAFKAAFIVWVIIGVALLLVAAMIWRGDGPPKIES